MRSCLTVMGGRGEGAVWALAGRRPGGQVLLRQEGLKASSDGES